MTLDEIYDEVKKNGIPVGLDAWLPKEPEAKEPIWKNYVPKDIEAIKAEARKDREQKEKEALETAKMYFGEYN